MVKELQVGEVFYQPSLFNGEVHKYEVLDIGKTDTMLLIDDSGKCAAYTRELEEGNRYSTIEEAQEQVDKEIERVKEAFSTPEKLLNYTYNKTILTIHKRSYYDIVGLHCLTTLELREFENKCKEFFGVTLIEEGDE